MFGELYWYLALHLHNHTITFLKSVDLCNKWVVTSILNVTSAKIPNIVLNNKQTTTAITYVSYFPCIKTELKII